MKKIFFLLLSAFVSLSSFAQDDLGQRARAAKAAGGATLQAFEQELVQKLAEAKDEKSLSQVGTAYYYIGQQAKYDEVYASVLKKYPKGQYARTQACNKLYDIQGGEAMEKAYLNWAKTYPESKLGFDIVCDYAVYSVANNYAKENNVAKAFEYLHKLQDKAWKSTAYGAIGSVFKSVGNTEAQLQCAKEAAEACDAAMSSTTNERLRREYQSVYVNYADILLANGQKEEALKQYEKVDIQNRGTDYALLMIEEGHPMHAFVLADGFIRRGQGGTVLEEMLKQAWQKANGNLEGYEAYLSSIKAQRKAEKQKEIAASMISQPAPDFELKDSKGQTVRLSDLKGKIVILDYWATWCGPCKRSLPAMKMTVDKYKDDPNVQFLFIHTWERGTPEAALADAVKYLADNGFADFHLVMDTKDPDTKTNKAVSAYGVEGIPAKFIIDGEGNIRFKISGFGGSDEEAVEELTTMIEMCRKK